MKHIKIIFEDKTIAKDNHNSLTVLKSTAIIANDYIVNSTHPARSMTFIASTSPELDFLLESSITNINISYQSKDLRMIFLQKHNWNYNGNQTGPNQTRLRCTMSDFNPVPVPPYPMALFFTPNSSH